MQIYSRDREVENKIDTGNHRIDLNHGRKIDNRDRQILEIYRQQRYRGRNQIDTGNHRIGLNHRRKLDSRDREIDRQQRYKGKNQIDTGNHRIGLNYRRKIDRQIDRRLSRDRQIERNI